MVPLTILPGAVHPVAGAALLPGPGPGLGGDVGGGAVEEVAARARPLLLGLEVRVNGGDGVIGHLHHGLLELPGHLAIGRGLEAPVARDRSLGAHSAVE